MHYQAFLQVMSLTAAAALLGGCGHGNAPARSSAGALGVAAPVTAASTAAGAGVTRPNEATPTPPGPPSSASPKSTYCTALQQQPLTQADIDLYLEVMKAAAARVQHPTAADLDAVQQEQAFEKQANATAEANAPAQEAMEAKQQQLQAQMQNAMSHGDIDKAKQLAEQQIQQLKAATAAIKAPSMPDVATAQLATDLGSGHADRVIVRERHLDEDRWDCIVDAIEEAMPPPTTFYADCGTDCGFARTPAELKREHEHELLVAHNRKLLAPYAKLIHSLQAIVRAGKV